MKPFVSICIPVFNGEEHLEQCLDSAIAQSYLNIEIIIINDRSTDSSQEIINNYSLKDKRIKSFVNFNNLGLTGNWNKCIEYATGEWIKFLFQDDYLAKNCIEKMLNASSSDDGLLICKRTFILNESADDITRDYYNNKVVTFEKLGIADEITYLTPRMISRFACENICLNFIGEPTSTMFKKKILNTIGPFNDCLAQLCDFEFALRVGSNYGITYIPEPLTFFRIHEESTTSTNLNKKEFVLRHLDPIITVRQMLYNSLYKNFRSLISYGNIIKLRQFFAIRTHEAYLSAAKNYEYINEMNQAAEKFPELKKFMKPDFLTQFKLGLVLLRRKIRTIFS